MSFIYDKIGEIDITFTRSFEWARRPTVKDMIKLAKELDKHPRVIQHQSIMGIARGNMMLACTTGDSDEYLCWLYLAQAEAMYAHGPTPAFDYLIRQMSPDQLIPHFITSKRITNHE